MNRPYSSNGLNQYTQSGSVVPTYDARGNLTSAGGTLFSYNSQNMLVGATGERQASLAYDPFNRLFEVTGPATRTRFGYDGLNLIAEADGAGTLLRRYVHGPGVDEPLVQYEGSATLTRRFLHADERGSVVAVSSDTGASFARNSYDEYGIPGSTNYGRFQYTGQTWLPELGMYHYKARIYSPTLGRFLQTDPIGYAVLQSCEGDLRVKGDLGRREFPLSDLIGEDVVGGPGAHECREPFFQYFHELAANGDRERRGAVGVLDFPCKVAQHVHLYRGGHSRDPQFRSIRLTIFAGGIKATSRK